MSEQKKPSHIPLFVDSYLKDTTHLTAQAHGAYLLLMMAAWVREDCCLPNDERRLANIAKMTVKEWRAISQDILELWTIEGDKIFQKRLLKEWHYVKNKSAKNKRAADKRWQSERNANAYADADANAYADGMHLGGGVGGGGGGGSTSKGIASVSISDEEPFA